MNGKVRKAARRRGGERARALSRVKLAAPARKRTRGRTASTSRGLNPRVVQALDSMTLLAEFGRVYEHGAPIPDEIWTHAEIVGEYLGYPPPERWLRQWLQRKREE